MSKIECFFFNITILVEIGFYITDRFFCKNYFPKFQIKKHFNFHPDFDFSPQNISSKKSYRTYGFAATCPVRFRVLKDYRIYKTFLPVSVNPPIFTIFTIMFNFFEIFFFELEKNVLDYGVLTWTLKMR